MLSSVKSPSMLSASYIHSLVYPKSVLCPASRYLARSKSSLKESLIFLNKVDLITGIMQFLHFPLIFYLDIDECKTMSSPCGTYNSLSCVNEVGTYSCRCKMGYAFNRRERKCQGNFYFNCTIKRL